MGLRMPDDIADHMREISNCCACGLPMRESHRLHFVFLGLLAEWNNPVVVGSIGDRWFRGAMAVVCDECVAENQDEKKIEVDILYAIEIRNNECFYHNVDDLKSIE